MKTQKGSTGIAIHFFNIGATWGVGGQRHVPAALPPGKRPGTHFKGGWVAPGSAWTGAGNFATAGIRSADRPTLSEIGEEEA
jgi:hypothetical protein